MQYSILYQGVPVATFTADSAKVGCVVVHTDAGLDRIRGALPAWWADTNDVTRPGPAARVDAVELAQQLELRDECGALVATSRIELCITGPTTALAVITREEAPAQVQATLLVAPRGSAGAAEE